MYEEKEYTQAQAQAQVKAQAQAQAHFLNSWVKWALNGIDMAIEDIGMDNVLNIWIYKKKN